MQNKNFSVSIVSEGMPDIDFPREKNEGTMPVFFLPGDVVMPGVAQPLICNIPSNLQVARMAEKKHYLVALMPAPEDDKKIPAISYEETLHIGVCAKVIHIMELPDGSHNVLIQALNRIGMDSLEWNQKLPEAKVTAIPEVAAKKNDTEYIITIQALKSKVQELATLEQNIPDELIKALLAIKRPHVMVNTIATHMPLSFQDKLSLLSNDSDAMRATELLRMMNQMLELLRLKQMVENKTQADLSLQQREWFINQEIKNLQSELGHKDEFSTKESDIEEMRQKAAQKQWSAEADIAFRRGIERLSRIHPSSSDYNVELTWLQTILKLPWQEKSNDNLNIERARKILDRDHYGMEKIKERILEHLAVLRLRRDMKSPILCLYGPPGVGKTSLGKSIAEALGRKYVRMSLGGLHDEAEIRGHRRTYVGAMPGRIIKSMEKAGTANPVIVLDEIDKVNDGSHNGDPSSALLEVLDPEQNHAFHDNYLDLDYDLSQVMFVATANDIQSIPRPLLDRMELVELSGYTTEEKVEIAKKHLVKKEKEATGLKRYTRLNINKGALEFLIESYTRESGVRGLEKEIGRLMRRIALKISSDILYDPKRIEIEDITEMLGKPKFSKDIYQGNEYTGVVTGLAWTSVGGVILFIETSLSKGKEGKLTLTGNLGDVMKESAQLALEYIKSHADEIGIDMEMLEKHNIHIHVPEGATPKDGPSAGITMATSLASALTGRKVRKSLAMTGEITLRGKVLPVGGIKEKILAAKRAGITQLVLCQENRKDIEEIPAEYLTGLSFHYVDNIMQVLEYALI